MDRFPFHLYTERPICLFARNFLHKSYSILQNDSIFLNFPISPENRNLDPLTIKYDMGHPVYTLLVMVSVCLFVTDKRQND